MSEQEYRHAMLERTTELLSRSTRLAIESAQMAREHAELVAELARASTVERIPPQPERRAALRLVERAG